MNTENQLATREVAKKLHSLRRNRASPVPRVQIRKTQAEVVARVVLTFRNNYSGGGCQKKKSDAPCDWVGSNCRMPPTMNRKGTVAVPHS